MKRILCTLVLSCLLLSCRKSIDVSPNNNINFKQTQLFNKLKAISEQKLRASHSAYSRWPGWGKILAIAGADLIGTFEGGVAGGKFGAGLSGGNPYATAAGSVIGAGLGGWAASYGVNHSRSSNIDSLKSFVDTLNLSHLTPENGHNAFEYYGVFHNSMLVNTISDSTLVLDSGQISDSLMYSTSLNFLSNDTYFSGAYETLFADLNIGFSRNILATILNRYQFVSSDELSYLLSKLDELKNEELISDAQYSILSLYLETCEELTSMEDVMEFTIEFEDALIEGTEYSLPQSEKNILLQTFAVARHSFSFWNAAL